MDSLTLFKPEKSSAEATKLVQKASTTHVNADSSLIERTTALPKIYEAIETDSKLKRDKLVKEDLVRLSADLKAQNYPFTKNGLLTLNDFTEIPNAMFEYLYERQYFADYADYCNHELDKRSNKKRVTKEFLLRFRKIEDKEHIRGVLSKRYTTIDHIDVLKAIFKALPGGKFDCKCTNYFYDGDGLSANVLMPDYIKDDEGSEYSCGFYFQNSEIKTKTYSIKPYLYKKVGGNGYIWGRRDLILSVNKRHVGKIDTQQINTLTKTGIDAALTMGKSLVKLFSYAKKIQVNNGLRVIASICRDYKLSFNEGKKIHECYLAGSHANTAFGIIDAISTAALSYSGEDRVLLENVATHVLATSLDTTKDSMEKRWASINSKSQLLDAKVVEKFEYKGA